MSAAIKLTAVIEFVAQVCRNEKKLRTIDGKTEFLELLGRCLQLPHLSEAATVAVGHIGEFSTENLTMLYQSGCLGALMDLFNEQQGLAKVAGLKTLAAVAKRADDSERSLILK